MGGSELSISSGRHAPRNMPLSASGLEEAHDCEHRNATGKSLVIAMQPVINMQKNAGSNSITGNQMPLLKHRYKYIFMCLWVQCPIW